MITVASHESRTILGRLDKGADVIQGLLEACGERLVRCGTVSAMGALESVELLHYDVKRKRYGPSRVLAGPLEILSAVGNLSERHGELSLHLHMTLSRETDNGIEVVGGHVAAGKVFACEFAIVALDDVLLRRGEDKATGLPLWKEGFERDGQTSGVPTQELGRVASSSDRVEAGAVEPDTAEEVVPPSAPEPEPEPEPESIPASEKTPAAGTSWRDVVAASQQAQAGGGLASAPAELPPRPVAPVAEDDEDDELEEEQDYLDVSPGDVIEHPKFGRCRVERIEGDDEFVQVRLRNKNLVRLSLDIISLKLVGHEGGHQVFEAKIEG